MAINIAHKFSHLNKQPLLNRQHSTRNQITDIAIMYPNLLFIYAFILFPVSISQFVAKDLAILYDSDSILSTHSAMLDLLKDYSAQGYDIVKLNNKSFTLTQFDQLKYKNVFIISNGNNRWALTDTQVFDFADKGGNVFIVGSHEPGKELSKLITGFGFVDRKQNALVDHAHSLISEEYTFPKTVVIDAKKYSCPSSAIFTTPLQSILYRGRGFGIDLTNPTTFAILTASRDSYLFNSDNFADDSSLAVGTSAILVGGVEMRNSARAVLMGSVDALTDKTFFSTIPQGLDQQKFPVVQPGNLPFFTSLCEWAFQRHGVIRVLNPSHTLVSSGASLDEYIVETLLEYSITVQQLDNGIWKPYVVDDMQLEVTRLTTFGRVTYNSTTNGVYTARFYAPDFIGIYGLHTRYRKLGFTTLDHQVKIIIRPRRHNDYDRIIRGAWPYYLTAFLMMFMVFALIFALLNQKSQKEKTS